MFKEIFRSLDVQWMGNLALLIFFACFVAIVIWAFTRPRKQMDACRRLPLEDQSS